MITVKYLKPFHIKRSGKKLRLVFAYHYLSILKDNEVYHFIPIEGKEVVINTDTYQIENLTEVFVFQRGDKFVRLSIYQLMLDSDIDEYLTDIVDEAVDGNSPKTKSKHIHKDIEDAIDKAVDNLDSIDIIIREETSDLIEEIMSFHKENYINKCLDNEDFERLKDVI